MTSIARRLAAPITCGLLGAAFALGCVYAAGPAPAATITTPTPSVQGTDNGDGSVTRPGALVAALDLPGCAGEDREPVLPCHVVTTPTYVVGGDNVRHEGCYVVLTTPEDSEMVCRDDSVWLS